MEEEEEELSGANDAEKKEFRMLGKVKRRQKGEVDSSWTSEFRCVDCGKCFSSSTSLDEHSLQHNSKKPGTYSGNKLTYRDNSSAYLRLTSFKIVRYSVVPSYFLTLARHRLAYSAANAQMSHLQEDHEVQAVVDTARQVAQRTIQQQLGIVADAAEEIARPAKYAHHVPQEAGSAEEVLIVLPASVACVITVFLYTEGKVFFRCLESRFSREH